MKAKENKTNAMRVLDRAKIPYETYSYGAWGWKIDGVSVAQKLGQPVEQVFKTLVTRGTDRNFYVFVIPVAKELNLKAAARAVGQKSVEMIHVDEIKSHRLYSGRLFPDWDEKAIQNCYWWKRPKAFLYYSKRRENRTADSDFSSNAVWFNRRTIRLSRL